MSKFTIFLVLFFGVIFSSCGSVPPDDDYNGYVDYKSFLYESDLCVGSHYARIDYFVPFADIEAFKHYDKITHYYDDLNGVWFCAFDDINQ